MTKTTSPEPHQFLATPAQPATSGAGCADVRPAPTWRRLFNEWSLTSLGLVVFCAMQILGVWELHVAGQGEAHSGLARALTLMLLAGTAVMVALVDRWRRRHFEQCAVLLQTTRMNAQLREEKGAV